MAAFCLAKTLYCAASSTQLRDLLSSLKLSNSRAPRYHEGGKPQRCQADHIINNHTKHIHARVSEACLMG